MSYANALKTGEGVQKDMQEAVRYYKLASEKRSDFAVYNLAESLKKGEGVPIDIEEGNKCIKIAAENGNYLAKHDLNKGSYTGAFSSFGSGTSTFGSRTWGWI